MDIKESPRFADVVLPVPVDRRFTYNVPPRHRGDVAVGCRVVVPFGRRRMTGYVVALRDDSPEGVELKDLSAVIDNPPLITGNLISVAESMSRYYIHTLGEVLRAVLPASVKGLARGRKRQKALEFPDEARYPELTEDQAVALRQIVRPLSESKHAAFLLHGVTGSGKTEVYLRSIEEALRLGKGAIVLIPEIALIPQATSRFKQRFGSSVEVYHSRLTGAEKHGIWQRALNGETKVVIGARSAVFVPVLNLGIIVVDEEQDDSFKQQEKPHYNAVTVARMRARQENGVLVLGSATPSLESFKESREGGMVSLKLSTRPSGMTMPEVVVVDMRGRDGIFSDELLEELESVVARREKALILMNRRGHANFVQCKDCGWIDYCPRCSISLTFHSREHRLVCHYCGYEERLPDICPKCGSYKLQHRGFGTERLEMELVNLLPEARVARMDMDTTRGKEGHEKVLEEFVSGRKDILLGTQMVAKGHHYPDITLIGIISADYGLHFPDFRAAERTFRLCYQAAGRTGRGKRGGKVIVQTFAPDHHMFRYLREHDYDGFAVEELASRVDLRYPPYGDLMLITVSSVSEARAAEACEAVYDALGAAGFGEADLLGPAPALLKRIKGRYRMQILIKGALDQEKKRRIVELSREALANFKRVEMQWDVDPINLM
ncbi:primosomal protein N' [bacterium]|nr:MAG: primosomal protein N' [bacterium]